MSHKFRTAEDYRDHLPCYECEPWTEPLVEERTLEQRVAHLYEEVKQLKEWVEYQQTLEMEKR